MAKRLTPLERYLRNCLWCTLPFVQKDPEQVYCCPAHQRKAREAARKKLAQNIEYLAPREIDSRMVEYDPTEPMKRMNVEQAREALQNMRHIPDEEPSDLTGLELLMWRNEHRKPQTNE